MLTFKTSELDLLPNNTILKYLVKHQSMKKV